VFFIAAPCIHDTFRRSLAGFAENRKVLFTANNRLAMINGKWEFDAYAATCNSLTI